MKKIYFISGIFFLILSIFLYQSSLNQMQEIEEMIRAAEIARIEAKPGVERIGLSIDQIEQLSDDLKSTILISRATFVLGIFLVIYAIQKELFNIKNKLN